MNARHLFGFSFEWSSVASATSQVTWHMNFQIITVNTVVMSLSNQTSLKSLMSWMSQYNRVHIKGSHWLIEWFKTCKTSFFCFFLWRFPCIELLDYKYGQYGYLHFFLYHLVVIYIYISSYICIFLEYTHHLLMSLLRIIVPITFCVGLLILVYSMESQGSGFQDGDVLVRFVLYIIYIYTLWLWLT
jgi:hypothetical protein